MNEDLNEIMADLSLTQDPQRQQPQPPAPRPDIIDQARGVPAPSDIVEQARVQPGFDTSRPVSVDGPMNAFAAQRMQALLDPQQQGMLPQQPPVRGMEEPPTVDDTRNLIRDMMASDSAALTASFNQVYKTNSDFAARADRMAKFLGMDMATVERNPQEVQQLFDVMDLQSRDLVRNNPALAQDLTNPGFMAIAKDDLDNLSWWTSGANAWELGALNAEMGKLGHELKFLDDRGLKSEGEPIRMRIAEIRNRMAQLPVAEEGFGSFIGSAAQMGGLYGTFLPEAAATGAAVAIPATMIAGAATGPAAPIAAPLAGAAGFLKVSGASFTFQTAQVSSGLSYLEQVQNGVDPSVAYYTSSIAGIGEALLDRIGLKGAAEPAKKMLTEMTAKELAKALAKPTWGEIATKYGTDVVKVGLKETATEMGQDLVNIMAEDLGRSFTKGEIESRLATEAGRAEIYKRMAQTLEMTLKGQALLAPAFGSPTLFGGIYQRRAMAEQQKKVLEGIANNAAESKVRKRDPNVYETIVQNQLEQLEQLGGADAKTVYVAPERFLEAMQGVGMTEAELLKLLPDQIESIREAIRNGSDIQIPTAKFASTLADTNLGRALILDMRLSDNPNVLSAREAEEQGKQLREQLETAAKMVDEDIAADKALEADIRAVENLFYEQNVRIPNIGKDNAKALSVMQTRMVHTLARESGMPLQQFYEKYRAQFTEAGKPPMFEPQVGAEPAELFDSLGQRKTDTPQFKAWFGESKVVDEQGQPLKLFHGSITKNLKRFDLRKAVEVEGGIFFSSNPDVAQQYTYERAYGEIISEEPLGEVVEAYLSIQNPLEYQLKPGQQIVDAVEMGRAIRMAKDAGHDGIIIRNIDDSIGMTGDMGDVYVAFNPTQIKSVNNRGTFDPASANIFEQVEKLDADYMAAVERGDMETAQRMVDQAAKAAGYNRKAYHGSASKPFWVFDPAKRGQRTGSNSALLGFFASSERQVASEYQLTESERRRFNEPTQFAFGLEAAEAQYGRKTEIVTAGVFDKDQNGWVAQLTEYDQFGSEFTYEDEYVYDSQVEAENAAEEYKERQVKEAQAVLDKKLAEFAEEEKNLRAERTLHDLWVRLENPLIYDFKGGSFRDKSYTELVKEAIEDGHDGVVMRNTMDAIDSGTLSDVIVFFNSNQAKLADPVTRDEQGNIIPLSRRFNLQSPSILEQLGEEAQPRLMAVHNLTADNLRFADGIGGLAVPSVGVVTEEAGEVRGFGEITLIGTKSMIDPAREPVFTSDAYSQRFPDPKWRKPKVKDADALYNQVKDVSKEFGDELAYFVEELTGRRPNAGELLKKWLNSTAAKVLWLRSQGETVTPILSDPQFEFQLSVDALERIRPVFSAWFKADKDAEPSDRAQLPELAQLEQAFANEYSKVLIDDGYTAEEAARLTNTTIENRNIGMIFEKMYFALRQGRKPDVYANSEMVNKQLADREIEFRKWSEKQVFSKFDAPYLTLGRRSVPYTLDNIVDYMTRPDNIVGAETMPFGVTPGSVRAATSERLESLEQMRKAAKSSITDEAEYSKAADITSNKLGTYVDAVRSFSKYGGMDASDGAMRALAKFATRKTRTVEQLRKELAKEYYDAAKIPVEALELGVEAAEALLKAPVPYFEAKPQRAVNLNEFAGAVIPQDATQETKDLLTKNGIPFTTYASDTERTAVVRQFTQQLSQQRGDVLSQLADGPNPGFYSALLRSMDAVTAKALPANGWKDQIRGLVNKGVVKQAEVELSGLNEWLDMQEGKVTKEAVVAFLQGNGVKVETDVLGYNPNVSQKKIDEIDNQLRTIDNILYTDKILQLSKEESSALFDERDALEAERLAIVSTRSPSKRTKYEVYSLPGGKNYREVLLTLGKLPADDYARFGQAMRDKYGEQYFANMTEAEDAKYKLLYDIRRGFLHQHWQNANVLAHLRMDDRVDANGKKVLFVLEGQSDWGQTGRDEGFISKAMTDKYLKAVDEYSANTERLNQRKLEILQSRGFKTWAEVDDLYTDERVDVYKSVMLEASRDSIYNDLQNNAAKLSLDIEQLRDDINAYVPRGPFVETTKGWVELALKKVMLIAAEGGYDRVAFINGAEAAKQVSASSEVSKIQYNQKTGAFIGYDASGSKVITEKVPQEKLTDYVGAELAAKLTSESLRPIVMSRKDYDAKHNLQTSEFAGKDTPWVVVRDEKIIASYKTKEGAQSDLSLSIAIIENIDVVVGDAGMKAFYDKIMPNYLNDLLAKFGKTKSKMVNVEGIGEHLGFDVTPELLDKISEGLPLFSPKQRGTFDPRTLVSAIMSGGKSDTVMHEMWHYYFVMLERFALAGDAPPKLAQDFDTLLAWLKVPGATADERLVAWRNMTFEQRKPYHENTAYAWEIWLAKGEAPSVELEGIFKRMLRWFRETYNDIVTELKALYRQNYGRELILPTSEIEQIFARALASQEEIDRAMVVRNIQFPYSDAEQAQMRPETLGALKEMWEEMVEEAVINVTGKSISDMQWLSGAETPAMREMQKRHDTLREQVREQVAEQVRMEPIYRAMRHFQTGEMVAEDGTVSNAGSNYKLNSRMTQALLPEGKTLTNLRGMTNRKGLDPSEVAQWYGHPDGKTFVAALANAKPMTEEIKERTDKRMLEEHGDLVNPVQRQRAIERAINNDTRTQFLAAVLRHTDMALRKSVDALSPAAVKQVEQATAKLAELKQTREALRAQLRQAEEAKLAEVIDATNEQLRDNQRAIARERRKISGPITPVRDLVKAAERNADQTLATKKVGEVSSYRYGQQQARASRDAQEAVKKMDLAEVVRAQQKELILHALTKKAAEFEDFVADKLDDYRKFTKDTEKLRKTRDMDLVNVAKAILASYGMGVEVDGIDKRLERFKEANPELYAEFEGLITDAKANARPYRELTVEEFQAVTDAVDRLWYEAKRRLEVGKEGERQALGEVVDLMIDRLVKIGLDAVLPGTTGKETEAEKLAVQIVDMASCVTRIQHWCNKMDELTFGLEAGVFTKNIWRRIQNATSEYLLARDKEIKELADLSKALYTGGPTLYSKHLGYTFGRDRGHSGKAEILGMLLHMGNRDNLERLLTGRQITELGHPDKGKPWGAIDEVTGEVDTSRFIAAVQEFIADGTLTQADFDWVQSMWDKIEQVTENYVQPSHKLQTGDYLDLIPPDSFTIRFKDGTVKTYKGGYIPSKIDPAVSSKGRDIENFTELEQDVRQRRPRAADGMTKKRVQGVREPRIMDPMLVVQAIDEELRYSILGPAINDVLKIANDERLNEAMNRFDRGFIKKTLIPWLNVVATQRITQPPLGGQLSGRVFTGLRTSVAMQALGFNVLNAAQNITGIPTGIYKAGPITYAKAVAEFIYNPKKVIDVIVNSDGIMAERLRLTMFDAETEMKRIFENPSAFNTTMTYVRSSMMILQKVSQNLIDITVWLASYNKAMRSMGADKNNAEAHAEAVRRARETVTLTQYSQRPEDVAKIEVKPAEVRVFTQFFGYINGLAQLAGGEWKKYIRSDLGLPSKAAGLVYIYLLCWLAPSLINDLLKRAATDDWEDEDDNGYIDGMFYDVAIKPSMQSVPVVGQVAELAANGFDDKPYNDRLNIAPAVSMVSGAVSEAAKSANKWIRSGELGEEQIYDWITLMGYLTKFPTRPFVKPLEYEAQVEAGKVTPTSSYDYYRGLITGRASPESKQ